jgi:hypothetical protein
MELLIIGDGFEALISLARSGASYRLPPVLLAGLRAGLFFMTAREPEAALR